MLSVTSYKEILTGKLGMAGWRHYTNKESTFHIHALLHFTALKYVGREPIMCCYQFKVVWWLVASKHDGYRKVVSVLETCI